VNQAIVIPLAIDNVVPAAVNLGTCISLITFRYPSSGFDAAGAQIDGWTDVPGLVDIACMSAVPSQARIQATEVRALEEITSSELHHVWIPGYYIGLDDGWRGDTDAYPGQWVAIVGDNVGGVLTDGYQYQIMGVEFDSQEQMTRVQLKLATM